MKVYEGQVQRDEEQLEAKCQELDGELDLIENELKDIIDRKAKVQASMAELNVKASPQFWKNVLEGEGLLSAEAEVRDKDEALKVVQAQLLQAVRETGIANPERAAQILQQHERSQILLTEAATKSAGVVKRIEGWADFLEKLAVGDSGRELAQALFTINEEHQKQVRLLKKSKSQVLEEAMDSLIIALPEQN